MIAIVDYGVGNLFSLQSSFACIGQEAVVTGDPDRIAQAQKIVLPGVGAFADAARKLRQSGLDEAVRMQVARGRDLLGICLGMQMLFEKSYEYGEHTGLGLIAGSVREIPVPDRTRYKIPHIGWNALHLVRENPLFANTREGDCGYFVHSYHGTDCAADTIAETEYGVPVTAAVAHDNVYGTQFHPEKSGAVGLGILRAFCAL